MKYLSLSFLRHLYREKRLEVAIGLAVVGLVGVILFLGVVVISGFGKTEPTELDDDFSIEKNAPLVDPSVVVEVRGEVLRPGVYTVPSSSRVQDAIQLAGGFLKSADANFVAQKINLAKKIEDQEKIFIPAQGIEQSASASSGSSLPGKTSINSATQKELEALPVIGQVTAEKVVASRPFSSLVQFYEKMKFSEKDQDDLRELISL